MSNVDPASVINPAAVEAALIRKYSRPCPAIPVGPGAIILLPGPDPYDCKDRNAMGPACKYTHQHPDDPKCAGCWWNHHNVSDSR